MVNKSIKRLQDLTPQYQKLTKFVSQTVGFWWWRFLGLTVFVVTILLVIELLGYHNSLWQNISDPGSNNPIRAQIVQEETQGLTGDRLEITQMEIAAPIVFDVDGVKEKEYLKALEGGVAHMSGTSRPDEKGNMFIFGHSDYYKLKPGNYKEVFKKLDVLKKDDQFSIFYQDKEYKYKVSENKVVDPNDWSISAGSTPDNQEDKTLTIMTCWPPGTLKARRAVFAVQI